MISWRRGCMMVGVTVAIGMLAGCAGSDGGVAQTVRLGAPEGLVLDPLDAGPAVTWIERDETFAIVTWGSGSCPPVAVGLSVEGPDRMAVTFAPSPNDPCTADMAPTTHEFELPEEVARGPIVVEVSYEDWPEVDTLMLE